MDRDVRAFTCIYFSRFSFGAERTQQPDVTIIPIQVHIYSH